MSFMKRLFCLVACAAICWTGPATSAQVAGGAANLVDDKKAKALLDAGELCDVDGRIGGFNFQWAWASGFIAGSSAAQAACAARTAP